MCTDNPGDVNTIMYNEDGEQIEVGNDIVEEAAEDNDFRDP